MNSYHSRFAPTPSGQMHVGHVRIMLYNYTDAIKCGGSFLLRIDDTDTSRCKKEYENSIIDTMQWIGIQPSNIVRQSDRNAIYNEFAEKLKASGRLYPCFETEEELSMQRAISKKQLKPYVYNRASLNIRSKTDAEAHWRFKLDYNKKIEWHDIVRGNVKFNPQLLSDPIVIRQDGSFTYMFPSVIDDATLNISRIIRGEDHTTNTATQIQMFEAIGAKVPSFAHIPLIFLGGEKLSKRKDISFVTIENIQKNLIQPEALVRYLQTNGYTGPIPRGWPKLDEYAKILDLSLISKSSFVFDREKLHEENIKFLKTTDISLINERINRDGKINLNKDLWDMIRDNIESIDDIVEWSTILNINIPYKTCHDEKLIEAMNRTEIFKEDGDNQINSWIAKLSSYLGIQKRREIIMKLRNALLNRADGPPITSVLRYIGKDKIKEFISYNNN